MAAHELIAAIATPAGRGGIGIVRLSGADLSRVIEGIVGRPLAPRVATSANFVGAQGETLDQGLALYFPAPASYTGETVLEAGAGKYTPRSEENTPELRRRVHVLS